MKKLSFLIGLLFVMTSVFSQSVMAEYDNRDQNNPVSGSTTVDNAPPANTPPAIYDATSASAKATGTKDATLEEVDRLMSILVSKLPREQRETIRKSDGAMYDYVPTAVQHKGKQKIKSRKIIQIMPANTNATIIDPNKAFEENIPIQYFEVYGNR